MWDSGLKPLKSSRYSNFGMGSICDLVLFLVGIWPYFSYKRKDQMSHQPLPSPWDSIGRLISEHGEASWT